MRSVTTKTATICGRFSALHARLPNDRAVAITWARLLSERNNTESGRRALDILRPKAGLSVPNDARAMLLIEVDGDADEIPRQVERVGDAMLSAGALDVLLARSEHERASLWAARREGRLRALHFHSKRR